MLEFETLKNNLSKDMGESSLGAKVQKLLSLDENIVKNFEIKDHIEKESPKSLKIITLLYKTDVSNIDFEIDWIGFKIDNRYFVGYGLDYKQLFRGLTGIYAIN